MLSLTDTLSPIDFPENFGLKESEVYNEEEFRDILEELFGDPYLDIHTGATKAVVIPDWNTDYVYKFPFFGDYSCERYGQKWEDTFFEFTGADGEEENNYCEAEIYYYDNEIPDNLKCFFAKTTKEQCRGVTYYKQENCVSTYDNYIYHPTKPISNDNDTLNSELLDLDTEWLAYAEEFFGEELVTELLNWLSRYDTNVNDLHGGNYGYVKRTGKPVIFDWGGYNG